MKRDWVGFSLTQRSAEAVTDAVEFKELCLAACLRCAVHVQPDLILIGGTDLAFFEGLPRTSHDLDFKTPDDADTVADGIIRELPLQFPGATAKMVDLYPRLKDKATIKLHFMGRDELISLNTLPFASTTARPRAQRLLNQELILMRESLAERWLEKVMVMPSRIFKPWEDRKQLNLHTRDLFDIEFLDGRTSREALAKIVLRENAGETIKGIGQKLNKMKGELLEVFQREMEELLDSPESFDAATCITATLRSIASIVKELKQGAVEKE